MEFANIQSRCVSSGTISQNDFRFGIFKNVQCVCISVTTCMYIKNVSRQPFASETIDKIIEEGTKYYRDTKRVLGPSHFHDHLNAEEVSPVLSFEGSKFSIATQWEANGVFPPNKKDFGLYSERLQFILAECFRRNSDSCLVFNGLGSAVSLWKAGADYFLFNSHSVNESNVYSSKGVGRLFVCNNLESLAYLLLQNSPFNNNHDEYELTHVISAPHQSNVHLSNDKSSPVDVNAPKAISPVKPNYLSDVKLSLKPVVVLEDISSVVKDYSSIAPKPNAYQRDPKLSKRPVVVLEDISKLVKGYSSIALKTNLSDPRRKRGRPAKTIGHPPISSMSSQEQNRQAGKTDTDKHPKANRPPVKNNTIKYPEINREKIKRHPDTQLETIKEKKTRLTSDNTPHDLPTQINKKTLIAEYAGKLLNSISPYRLKNTSLRSDTCYKCKYCHARLFDEEKNRSQWCCGQGRFNVLKLAPLPEPLYSDKGFLAYPRMYNDIFAFTALNIPGGYHQPRGGISFMRIKGRTYHMVYDLTYKGAGLNTSFLYIDDGEARLESARQRNLNPNVITSIQNFLQSCNPYIPFYKMLNDQPAENAHIVFEITSRQKDGPVLGDRPQCSEVAAFICCDSEPYNPRKFCIWKNGSTYPRTIDVFHPLVEPLQYPLLYPEGTLGWFIYRSDNFNKKLSQLKYIRCLLLSDDRFSKFGRLSETWLVDMYGRIDEERLRFIKYTQKNANQGGLRTAPIDEIEAVINNRTGANVAVDETVLGDGNIVPGRVYLPSSYTGGPRYMRVCYMDAMALVSRMGGPTYFLTFTAFGSWEEIKKSKQHYQEAHVVDRVFQIKLQELLRDIRGGKFFGKINYIVWVIEFQMRGLPHAHICFRVENGGSNQSCEIDKIVRADIPKPDEADGRLRSLVLRHMRHGPCGPAHRTDLPCWDAKKQTCTKFFPKSHNDTTYIDNKGFVQYRRNKENTAIVQFRGKPLLVDDLWIVPYNSSLLLKYECHANLEVASQCAVVKYLFKYISKGPSLRRISVVKDDEERDEVEEYVTRRYVGATDAAWRVLEFDITGREPTVITLPVHLEGKQSIIFRSGEEENITQKGSSSKLIIYFGRPDSPEMDNVTYLDFYEQFIVHTKKPRSRSVPVFEHTDGVHFITARQRGSCVARLFWVAPNRGEQYYLRMLLARYPCRGFNDLYALGGPDSTTFQQAARFLGLADNRNEFFDTFEEASKFMKANRLRYFFVLLVTIGSPAPDLWFKFKRQVCEDFLQQLSDDDEKAFKLGLIHIGRCLLRHGYSLKDVGLPVVEDNSTELGREKVMYSSSNQLQFVQQWEARLSSDQINVMRHIKSISQHDFPPPNSEKCLFLDGPGGSGKTVLLKVIAAHFRSLNKVVICVASSGIASLNLIGGTTAHSLFKFPLDVSVQGNWSITNGSQRAELIREASLIIFDETPMTHRFLIEMLDRSLRDLMRSDELFGGKIVIFAGDFRQIPPVVVKAKSPADIVNASVSKSTIWQNVKKINLITSHRTAGEQEYSSFLLQLGSNKTKQRIFVEGHSSNILSSLGPIQPVHNIKELISFVFPDGVLSDPDECANRVILSTHNVNVHEINNLILSSTLNDPQKLFSHDSVAEEDLNEFQIDDALLHHCSGKGIPDHVLTLKVGSLCLITRNLSFDLGLVNGTKVIIVAISRRLVTCRRPGSSIHFGVPRITFKFPIFANSPIDVLRKQFPLQLCYAMTVHKSQGQTIDVVGLDFRSDCFTHGQLYVAASRVRSPANIRVLVSENRVIDGTAYTKNVVYKDLIS